MQKPLNIRSAPLNEWTLHTVNIKSFDYNTEAWLGEAISKDVKRHQNIKYFSCGTIGHLRRDSVQGVTRNNVSSRNDKNRRSQSSGLCRRCSKGRHWINECWSTKEKQCNPLPSGNYLWGFSQAPRSNVVQSFPVTVEDTPPQENFKNLVLL